MKKLISILLLIIPILGFAQSNYYVSPADSGGSDVAAGTIEAPWATWQKAFDTADEGDTVFFRGGDYAPTVAPNYDPDDSHGNNGTYAAPIIYMAYEDEVPVLDCSNYTTEATKQGMRVHNVTYAKFVGLTVKDCDQIVQNQWIAGFEFFDVGTVWFDRMVSHDIMGYGSWLIGFDTLYVTNCDSYNNYDSNDTQPGNTADGFTIGSGTSVDDSTHVLYFHHNRAWNNSDDGFELSPNCQVYVYNNWAWSNGYGTGGAGVGMKYAHSTVRTLSKRMTYNNLMVFNKSTAFLEQNLNYAYGPVMSYFNNTAYKCSSGFGSSVGSTFNCATDFANVVYKNNLVYASTYSATYDQTYCAACNYDYAFPSYITDVSNNTWIESAANSGWEYNSDVSWAYTGKDAQFEEVDSATVVDALAAARGSDGSLPDIETAGILHLAAGSDLINAGIGVGLLKDGDDNYWAASPSIGAFEYDPEEPSPPELPIVSISTPTNTTSTTTIITYTAAPNGGTFTGRGVCWSTSINPTTSDTKTIDGIAEGSKTITLHGLYSGETIHIRAYATNETGTSYTADVAITTPSQTPLVNDSGVPWVDENGNIYIIK